MKVQHFIEKLERYKDFEIESVLHIKLNDEELEGLIYKYPFEDYDCKLEIDDISYSDKIVKIGIEVIK